MSDTLARTEAAAADLAVLLPAVPAALAKDNGAERSGSGPTVSGLPCNADVLSATDSIGRQSRALHRLVHQVLGDGARAFPGPAALVRNAPAMVRRLEGADRPDTAERVAAQLEDWRSLLRAALGLHTPAQPLGAYLCPLHPNPSPLLLLGAEGTLDRAPSGPWSLRWSYAEAIACRSCGARWARPQWPLLGRLLEDNAAA